MPITKAMSRRLRRRTRPAGWPAFVCAATVAAASPVADAATRATGSISELTITLVDLDAADGVTPSFTVLSAATDIRDAYGGNPRARDLHVSDPGPGPFDTVTLTMSADGIASQHAALGSGSGTPHGLALSAFSEVTSPAVPAGSFHAGTVYSASQQVSLSPRTELVISGRLRVTAEVDAGEERRASAFAALSVWDAIGGQSGANVGVDPVSFADEDTTFATVRLTNAGDVPLRGVLEVGLSTNAGVTYAVSPIPEPAPWLLALAGGVALWARRSGRSRCRTGARPASGRS